MNRVARHGGAVLLALGVTACQPPEPPLRGSTAIAVARPAREAAANDDTHAPRSLRNADGAEGRQNVPGALDHAGEVVIGARVSDLDELGPWTAQGAIDASGGRCDYYDGSSLPEGVIMMVDDGHVVRFDLGAGPEPDALAGQSGPFGVRLGMPRAQALALLPGDPTSSPDAYDDEAGEFLTWQDPDSDLALRLELHESHVVRMYWGTGEAIELIEGCA